MQIARLAAATTVVVVVLAAVTACGGSSDNSSQAKSRGSSTSTVDSAASTTAAASEAGSPNASASVDLTSTGPTFANGGTARADTTHLIYVLEAVDPKIGSKKEDLVAKSETLCAHINANEAESQLETDATKGFKNGSWVPSELEAQAIVGTVKAYGGC